MTPPIKLSFLIALMSLLCVDLSAQDRFEGVIRYQIKNSSNVSQTEMLPEYTEYHIRGNDLVLQMIGPENIKMARILIQGDPGAFYMVDDAAKTALKVRVRGKEPEGIGNVPEEFREEYEKALKKAENDSEFDQFDLEKTGESELIAGYLCEKYDVRAKNEEASMESEVWLTDKIKVEVPDALKDKNNPLLIFMNENGFPLKFIGRSNSRSQEQKVEMIATKVTRKTLDQSDFIIPDDYHISDMTGFLEGN